MEYHSTKWRLLSDSNGHACLGETRTQASMNMAMDEAIATSFVGAGLKPAPTIRFYTWEKPAVSIGYSQRIMPVIKWLNHNPPIPSFSKGANPPSPPFNKGEKEGIDIVRRPTGGGIVLHGADLTYSVVVRTLSPARNLIPLFYRKMGEAVIEGLRILGITASLESGVKSQESTPPFIPPFARGGGTQDSKLPLCAQTTVEYDVLVIPPTPPFNKEGKRGIKVAGCAARRFQETLLFQGYISIGHITDMMLQQVTDAMVKGFALALNVELVHGKLTDGELALAEELNNKKYSRKEWNYKR